MNGSVEEVLFSTPVSGDAASAERRDHSDAEILEQLVQYDASDSFADRTDRRQRLCGHQRITPIGQSVGEQDKDFGVWLAADLSLSRVPNDSRKVLLRRMNGLGHGPRARIVLLRRGRDGEPWVVQSVAVAQMAGKGSAASATT